MPPRGTTVNAAGTGVAAWYESIPPITRFYATAIFVVTLAARLSLFNPVWIALIWPRMYTHFEVWRLVTNFFFMGNFSLSWVFSMIWLLSYGKTLESQTFQFQPADFLFMLLFGAAGVLLGSGVLLLVMGIRIFFNALSLIFMLLYVWSRQFPEQQVSIYGLFSVLSFYVPFVFLALEFLISGAVPWSSILGVLVGHMYYYLTEIYPAISGARLLQTPVFLKNLLADFGVGRRINTHQATGQDGFRAFAGRGRRLGAN